MSFREINDFEKELGRYKGKIIIEAYKVDSKEILVALSLLNEKKSEIIRVRSENKAALVSLIEKNMEKVLETQRPLVLKVLKELKETNI